MKSVERYACVALALATSFVSAAPDVSAEAQPLLDQVRESYAKLKTLHLEGTLAGNFDAAGEKSQQTIPFKSTSDSAGRFRFDLGDEMVIVSTGAKTFVLQNKINQYTEAAGVKARVALSELPAGIAKLLGDQNCSLLLAVTDDAGKTLIDCADTVRRTPDETINGKAFPALTLATKERTARVLINPETHLVRRVTVDMKKALEASGAAGVNVAEVTTDYTIAAVDAPVTESFVWTPPRDARLAQAGATELMAGDDDAASTMVGKPAVDFTAPGMDDKPVKLSDFKGKVVVVDFWATWCPPCVAGLPHLDALQAKHKEGDFVVLAVNQQEDKPTVRKFMEAKKLTLQVLFDAQGDIAKKYGVTGIPQTVVIGKDGKVIKVTVGFSEELGQATEAAVEKALKQ